MTAHFVNRITALRRGFLIAPSVADSLHFSRRFIPKERPHLAMRPYSGNPRESRFGRIRLNLVDKAAASGSFGCIRKGTLAPTTSPGNLKRTYWFKGIYAFADTAGKNCHSCPKRVSAFWQALLMSVILRSKSPIAKSPLREIFNRS